MTDRPIPSLSRKRVDEDIPVSYDFANDIPSGVTISSVATCVATVAPESTISDSSLENIVSGAPSNSGLVYTQKIVDGVDGCTYFLAMQANGSDGMVYIGEATLLVSDPED